MSLVFRSGKGIAGAMLCIFGLLAPWAAASAAFAPPAAPRSQIIFVIAGGWHTELALPMAAIEAPLAALTPRFPAARYLAFGWGARSYYMAKHPGFEELLRAATPGPAVMLVIPLAVSPAAFAGPGNVFPLAISPAGAARLARFLWNYLVPAQSPAPRALGPGPDPGSLFYTASGSYDLSHTCNTWTAEALRAAGIPISAAGVVFAGQLIDQLRERR
ncbi:MAG TPA: DUF2459 domain-containing protein [Stellaceae bacterium]|jgi:uncharacterized protein (TIGR02117 family)